MRLRVRKGFPWEYCHCSWMLSFNQLSLTNYRVLRLTHCQYYCIVTTLRLTKQLKMGRTQRYCELFLTDPRRGKTAAAWPLPSNLASRPSITSNTCWRSKDKLISNILWTPTYEHTSVGWPSKNLQPSTLWILGALPVGMANRDRWQKRAKTNYGILSLHYFEMKVKILPSV